MGKRRSTENTNDKPSSKNRNGNKNKSGNVTKKTKVAITARAVTISRLPSPEKGLADTSKKPRSRSVSQTRSNRSTPGSSRVVTPAKRGRLESSDSQELDYEDDVNMEESVGETELEKLFQTIQKKLEDSMTDKFQAMLDHSLDALFKKKADEQNSSTDSGENNTSTTSTTEADSEKQKEDQLQRLSDHSVGSLILSRKLPSWNCCEKQLTCDSMQKGEQDPTQGPVGPALCQQAQPVCTQKSCTKRATIVTALW